MDRPTEIRTGDVRWVVEAGWQPLLLQGDGLPLRQWLETGRAVVVKHGDHRTVYRVDLGQRLVYIKHYRCQGLRALGKHAVRVSAARREWHKTHEALRRDVPTVRPVALGERRIAGLVHDNYLVTEGISGAVALDEFVRHELPQLPRAQRARRTRWLIDELARLTAQAHDAGVQQHDFHLGNVLVCRSEPSQGSAAWPLRLIDLPTARLGGCLPPRQTLRSLALLLASAQPYTTAAQQWRFWRAYRAARPAFAARVGVEAALRIARLAHQHGLRVARRRDKRVWHTNRDFRTLRMGTTRIHAVAELPPAGLRALAADPERLLHDYRHCPLKLSHTSVVVAAQWASGGRTMPIVYKRCRARRMWNAWRTNRAARAWYYGHALRSRGIATPRPLWVCLPRRGRDGYLATEWIAGGTNLHLFGWELAQRPPAQRHAAARRCAHSLGALLGRMHCRGVSHRDLKACNLLVAEHGESVHAWLIDLDSVRLRRRVNYRTRVQDLARLALSLAMHPWVPRTVVWRFLRAYCRAAATPGTAPYCPRALWRAVARRARCLARRRARRGSVPG
jgi:tRNA A-37 threonylcarbamoyl transferase component Bud32